MIVPIKLLLTLAGEDFTPADILGRSRARPIVWRRQLAMYWLRNRQGWSYSDLGRAFGRDHSTCAAGCRAVTSTITHSPNVVDRALHALDSALDVLPTPAAPIKSKRTQPRLRVVA